MMQAELPTREQLLLTIAKLQQEVEALQQDKADLEILLETTTEHSDTVEAELQSQAEAVARESDRRLAQFLEALPVGVFVVDAQGKPYYGNQAAQQLLGQGITPEASFDQLADVYQAYVAGTQQPYPSEQMPVVRALRGEPSAVDDIEIHQGDKIIPLETWATPIFDETGAIVYAIAAFQDITERKQAEAQLRLSAQRDRLLGEIALRIRQSLDLEQILNTTVTEVRQFLGCDRVGICYIDKNWQTKGLAESVAPGWRSLLGITLGDQTFSRNMLAYYQQGVQAVEDISQVDLQPASIEILQQYQIRAYLGAPIMLDGASPTEAHSVLLGLDHSEKCFGDQGFWLLVAHHCSGPRQWQQSEIDLLEQLGTQVAIAIQQAKLYQQLAALNADNEASLRASEERLRTLINATPDIICFKDGAGRWLESNQANLEFLELEGVNYRGKTDSELAEFSNFYRDALRNCQQTDEQAWQQGGIHRIEEIIPRPDGTVSVTDMIKVPLFDQANRRKALVVLGRDISDLKQVEEALRASEAQYRALVETANCIILRWDTHGNIRFINDYGQRLFGFASGELLGANVVGTIVPQAETSGRDLQALMTDICQHPENYLFNENENVCKNGERVWILWANKPILDQQGNLVEILSVGTDATKRKRVEAALEASETKFRTIVENANDVLFVINPEGVFSYLSPNLLNVTGYEPAELEGRSFMPLIYADDLPVCVNAVTQVVATGQRQSVEYRIRYKDGGYYWQVSNLAPSQDADSSLSIIGVARDISDRKQLEEELRQRGEQMRALLDAIPDRMFRQRLDGTYLDYKAPLDEADSDVSKNPIGKNLHDLPLPETLKHDLLHQFRLAVESGKLQTYEHELHKPDGAHQYEARIVKSGADEVVCIVRDITERKQVEEALRRSELKYRNIFENSQVGIGRTRLADGLVLDANQRFAEIMGYRSAADLINQRFSTEFYANPGDRQQILADIQQRGEVRNFELPLCQPDGSTKWGLLSLRLNAVEDCLDFVMTDISERKCLETERKHREEALRLIVEGTAGKTGDEFFLSCVRYLAEVLHVRYAFVSRFVDEAKTRVSTLAVWGEKMGKNFEYNVQNAPCGQVLQGKTCYYPRGLQSLFPRIPEFVTIRAESYLGIPLVDSLGNILGNLAVMDVQPMAPDPGRELILKIFAARAGAELERKQADEALQRRAQVESLLSSISRQFIDQDVDTAIGFTLRAMAQLIGAERSCMFEYADDQSRFAITHEWCAPGVPALPSASRGGSNTRSPWFSSQILRGQTIQFSRLAEFPPEAAAERELLQQHSAQSFVAVPTIHSGKVVGFLGVDVVNSPRTWSQEDISLLKLVGELIAIGRARYQAEEALRAAKEVAVREAARSADANRAKSTFLANMSHELRTPLNAILGFSQLMERDDGLTPRQQESLAIINRSGEHLLNLINDVLEMSKIEAGRITLNPVPFDLHRLLQTLEELFQIRAEAKQLSLQFDIAPALPRYVLADEGKLRQVLINLLGNAVKFTDIGGVRLRATAAPRSRGGEEHSSWRTPHTLYFEVEDTGRGIVPEEMDSLFQPFVQTTSGTQAREGTGLGLTISRQFVQLMGGDISLSSSISHGSTFCFHVQVDLAEPLLSTSLTPKGRVLKLAPGQPLYRVLVVDDRPENCQLIEQLLQDVGFETRQAANGQAAIAQWQVWQPHFIWMDMRMPIMDGYEATRRIRALERRDTAKQHTVIIALTASAFEEQRANILAAGCDDLVRKPFREPVIFDKIAEYLGVEYIYEQESTGEQDNTAVGKDAKTQRHLRRQNLKSSDLTVMPAAWIAELHQAATRVNAKLILQLLEQVPADHVLLADALKDLVAHYRFDTLVELTQLVPR